MSYYDKYIKYKTKYLELKKSEKILSDFHNENLSGGNLQEIANILTELQLQIDKVVNGFECCAADIKEVGKIHKKDKYYEYLIGMANIISKNVSILKKNPAYINYLDKKFKIKYIKADTGDRSSPLLDIENEAIFHDKFSTVYIPVIRTIYKFFIDIYTDILRYITSRSVPYYWINSYADSKLAKNVDNENHLIIYDETLLCKQNVYPSGDCMQLTIMQSAIYIANGLSTLKRSIATTDIKNIVSYVTESLSNLDGVQKKIDEHNNKLLKFDIKKKFSKDKKYVIPV